MRSKYQPREKSKKKKSVDRSDVHIQFERLQVHHLRELVEQISEIEKYSIDLDSSVVLKYKSQEAILEQAFLGQGGNGFVLKYTNNTVEPPKDKVAIKFLTREDSYTEELANNKLAQEAFEAAGREQNIIGFFESGKKEINLFGKTFYLFYIVMEFVDADLEKMICEKSTEDELLKQDYFSQIFKRLIEDLATLHSKGHIHRDLKPSNILLKGEYPILADFGLLAKHDSSEKKKGPKYWPTPEFVEPCSSSDQTLDKKTDVFQLGCVFYWMVTKKYPIGFFNFTQELSQSKIGPEITTLLSNMLAYEKSSRNIVDF